MRVLHVVPSLRQESGGPLRLVIDMSARAIRLGIESEVVGPGPIDVADNPLGSESVHAVNGSRSGYAYSSGLRQWLRFNVGRFDGVVLHGMWQYPQWAGAAECQRAGVPYACFPHGMLEPWAVRGQGLAKRLKKDVYWWLRERRIFDRARCIFFTTQREKNLAGTVYAIDRLMLIVTPYGVDFRLSDGEGDAAVRIRAISEGPYALFLGRVHRKKNPGLLLEAWARADVPPPWKLVIAGPCEDELQAELDGMVRRLGLTGRVEFPGFVGGADKACLLRSARWFVLPSSQENFGIAVLEAVQAGCPVAMSDQVFLSDEFHQEAEVMPVRVEVWAAFFAERMRDERHRETVMAMDRVTVAKRFDIEEVTRGWVETMEMAFRSQV